MRKAWTWTREHVSQVLGILVSVLLAAVGGGWLWRRQRGRLGRVKDKLAVEEAQAEIQKIRGVREELSRRVGEKDLQVALVDEELKRNQRKIIEAHERGVGLSDQEVADEFGRLGY